MVALKWRNETSLLLNLIKENGPFPLLKDQRQVPSPWISLFPGQERGWRNSDKPVNKEGVNSPLGGLPHAERHPKPEDRALPLTCLLSLRRG